jgi:hypothetical protein
MAETLSGILHERGPEGQVFYKEGMKLSGPDKARLIPLLKPGRQIEAGPANGVVTDLMLAANLGEIYGIEISDEMVTELLDKYRDNPKVHIVKHDIMNYDPGFLADSWVFSSNLHEVGSVGGLPAIIKTLENAYKHTRVGGVLAIRDGVQPAINEDVLIQFKTQFGVDRFKIFAQEFQQVTKVDYAVGTLDSSSLAWVQSDSGLIVPESTFVKLNSLIGSEFCSKYFYNIKNLKVECSERFGWLPLEGYVRLIEDIGYKVTHAEEYLLPFLLEKHLSQDFDYYHFVRNVVSRLSYPKSTMLLGAIK